MIERDGLEPPASAFSCRSGECMDCLGLLEPPVLQAPAVLAGLQAVHREGAGIRLSVEPVAANRIHARGSRNAQAKV